MEWIIIGVAVICGWWLWANHLEKKRREQLLQKYGDPEVVDRIMRRMFWQGQTPEQLIDSLGSPVDIDKKVLKTKSKEVWKYDQTGKGRFALRITLENGEVIGWDKKS
ncbi:DUF2845 domain-containing protein [Pseudomonas gingeri]|jgi:hypothetical protein|uniref:DUF2845 domain-containing protein n=1 Tax=Pseudomonas gingeri TaxID=117681 RepID=A0A7Y8BML3_9PSED|nr:DUF2845 domain-containing protein [Pseudomonas gingeri]NWB49229.1 DUF2845 domain-containing protein [Pseudomonas gingeri]